MALSEIQDSRIQELLDLCGHYEDRLTEWEHGFVYGNKQSSEKGFKSIAEKYEEEGMSMFLSAKQWEFINKIIDKLEAL